MFSLKIRTYIQGYQMVHFLKNTSFTLFSDIFLTNVAEIYLKVVFVTKIVETYHEIILHDY